MRGKGGCWHRRTRDSGGGMIRVVAVERASHADVLCRHGHGANRLTSSFIFNHWAVGWAGGQENALDLTGRAGEHRRTDRWKGQQADRDGR